MSSEVLASRALKKHFPIKEGVLQRVAGHVRALDGVDLAVRRGETLGLVGESGCGKSTFARCVAGLMEPTAGGVYYDGRNIATLKGAAFREYRRNTQMVFQDVFASLNPRQLVKDIVGRPLKIHDEASGAELLDRVVELLQGVGLGREHLYRYPHQFSGGQRQRISIARAIALQPEMVVLDEPTSALDVSVQAQILNLLQDLQERQGLTYLFITHDLGVVRHMADRVAVMHLGEVVELGATDEVFAGPKHPYTEALLTARPELAEELGSEPAPLTEGRTPDPAQPPEGCRLHTRCPVATPACGWEVDDVLWWLEHALPEAPVGVVARHSPFHAELGFPDEGAAAAAVAALEREGQPLRPALERPRLSGVRVDVRLRETDPAALEDAGGGHLTRCIHHAPAQRRRGALGAPDAG